MASFNGEHRYPAYYQTPRPRHRTSFGHVNVPITEHEDRHIRGGEALESSRERPRPLSFGEETGYHYPQSIYSSSRGLSEVQNANDNVMDGGYEYEEDSDMFVPEFGNSYDAERRMSEDNDMFVPAFGTDYKAKRCMSERDSRELVPHFDQADKFMVPFTPIPLRPSRNSGAEIPPSKQTRAKLSNMTPARPSNKKAAAKDAAKALKQPVSAASLKKRNLTRAGESEMTKRSNGPNDPENIQIVNMMENDKMKWADIAEVLNNNRIKIGRKPVFTPNSVHNRYNRNAPSLFAADGKEFIEICKRKKMSEGAGPEGSTKYLWTPELDMLLVDTVKEVEARKWQLVADIFNSKTECHISSKQAATRYGLI